VSKQCQEEATLLTDFGKKVNFFFKKKYHNLVNIDCKQPIAHKNILISHFNLVKIEQLILLTSCQSETMFNPSNGKVCNMQTITVKNTQLIQTVS